MPHMGESIIYTETGKTEFELVDGNVIVTGHSGQVTWRRAFSLHSLKVWIALATAFLAEVEAKQASVVDFPRQEASG